MPQRSEEKRARFVKREDITSMRGTPIFKRTTKRVYEQLFEEIQQQREDPSDVAGTYFSPSKDRGLKADA